MKKADNEYPAWYRNVWNACGCERCQSEEFHYKILIKNLENAELEHAKKQLEPAQ